jgi:DNA-binding XRE family transcriptional regulator
MIMSEKVRIEKVIQMVGLTSGQFAQEIGIQTSTLSHILNERNKPSLDVMKKILNRYPNINAEWLILGQGSIQRKESHSQAPTLFGDEDISGSISDSKAIYEPEKDDAEIFSFQHQTVKSEPVPVYTHPKTEIQQEKSHSFDKSDSTTQPPIMNNEIDVAKKLVDAVENLKQNQIIEKKVRKIILYYSDNTFQEFESK